MSRNPLANSVPRQLAGVPLYGTGADNCGGVKPPVSHSILVERKKPELAIRPFGRDDQFICPNCRKEFANKGLLTVHINKGCCGEPSSD